MRLRRYLMSVSPLMAMSLFGLLMLVTGCSSVGGTTLTIDPRQVVAVQDMRSEIISMLELLGYAWEPITDSPTDLPVQAINKFGQYRMLFRATDNASVQIEVRIRENNSITGLHFSEVGTDQPSETALEYYRKLKDRVVMQFGAENVSGKHAFRTP